LLSGFELNWNQNPIRNLLHTDSFMLKNPLNCFPAFVLYPNRCIAF